MKKTNYLAISTMAVALLVGGLTSCGGGKTDKGIVIKFWHTFGDTVETAVQKKVDNFISLVKKNEGVDVKVELEYKGGYSDIKKQVETALSSGDVPTIAVAYPDHVASYIKKQGGVSEKYVVNLQNFVDDPNLTFGTDDYLGDNQGIDDFHATTLHEGSNYVIDGMYSLTLMRSTEAMTYNETIVKDGLEYFNDEFYEEKYKKTLQEGEVATYLNDCPFEELMEFGRIIYEHKNDIGCVDLEYPVLYDSDGNLFITDLIQNGVKYASFDETTKQGKIDFEAGEDRTKAEALVNKLKEYYDAHLFATKGTMGEYSSNYFKEGKAVFVVGSTGGSGYTFPEAGSFDVGVARVPNLGKDRKYVTQGVNLTMLTYPNRAHANELKVYGWKLLKYLTSTGVNVDLCVNGSEGYMPVRDSCQETTQWQNFLKGGTNYAMVAKVVNNINSETEYLYTPAFPGSAELREQCGGIITSVLKKGTNTTDTFNQAILTAKNYFA